MDENFGIKFFYLNKQTKVDIVDEIVCSSSRGHCLVRCDVTWVSGRAEWPKSSQLYSGAGV